jgi:acetyltransferase-like isoleucine patch superfamily enzyme
MVANILVYLESAYKNNLYKIKGVLFKVYLVLHGCKVGKNLRCHKFPILRIIPEKNIEIGNYVTIGNNITIEIQRGGILCIGNKVKLTQNILISVGSEIMIGDYTLIGENVSIRDGDHNSSLGNPIIFQLSSYQPVIIGKDVWIGAGCYILKGSKIPEGVIIGANSVVLKNVLLEKNNIYAGSPIKKIGTRK